MLQSVKRVAQVFVLWNATRVVCQLVTGHRDIEDQMVRRAMSVHSGTSL